MSMNQCWTGIKTCEVELLQSEEELFNAVLKLLEELAQLSGKESLRNVSIRVAGGWVRDKIIGKTSKDIDFVLDESVPVKTLFGLCKQHNPKIVENINIVYANPDAGKQLDMVRMTVLQTELEFVNLRIAKVSVPLPPLTGQQFDSWIDASLRDLTINALFYNIKTRKVEDYVGGLEDIELKRLRTPLPPLETWSADPHRTLRVIRFLGHGFQLHPDVDQALRSPNILKMLYQVSRERVFTELQKIFSAPQHLTAVDTLVSSNLHTFVFDAPGNREVWDSKKSKHAISFYHVVDGLLLSTKYGQTVSETEPIMCLQLAALLMPFGGEDRIQNKPITTTIPFTKSHMRDVWKWPSKFVTLCTTLIEKAGEWLNLIDSFSPNGSNDDKDTTIVQAGLLLKEIGIIWPWVDILARARANILFGDDVNASADQLVSFLHQIGLLGDNPVWKWPPLIKSETLIAELNLQRGPIVSETLKRVFKWQLLNGGASASPHDCLVYLKQLQN